MLLLMRWNLESTFCSQCRAPGFNSGDTPSLVRTNVRVVHMFVVTASATNLPIKCTITLVTYFSFRTTSFDDTHTHTVRWRAARNCCSNRREFVKTLCRIYSMLVSTGFHPQCRSLLYAVPVSNCKHNCLEAYVGCDTTLAPSHVCVCVEVQ